MYDFFMWFTDLGNSKIAALLIFFTVFMGILLYVYTNKSRSERLESYKYIPFDDDQDEVPPKTEGKK
ncbi:MAG: cbb3-type cytochrome c oxidase subunit 3 [Cocleimonas sp.]|nr:cbb3-type cytochrome c oxidase subunit 3 [Cocleimonas sp.]